MDYKNLPKPDITTAKNFLLSLPKFVPPGMADGVDTNFHFDIEGEGGGQFSIIVRNGKVESWEGFEGEPKCVIKAKEKNFLALLRGELNPMMAVFSGKVKISNVNEVMKYAKMFGMM